MSLSEISIPNNRTVLDIRKCQWASFYYINQYDQYRHTKPKCKTYRNSPLDKHTLRFGGEETLLEFCLNNDLVDRWVPVIKFQLTANHNIVYTGRKAIVMWDAWNRYIFNVGGKKKGKKEI